MALMKSFHSILVLVMVALNHCTVWGSRSTSKSLNKLLSLKPIDITGVYRLGRKGNVRELDAVFLGRPNLDVISDEGDTVTVCDLIPLLVSRPVFSNKDQWSVSSLAPNPLVNRDGGLYDSIPYAWGLIGESKDDLLPLTPQELKQQVFKKCSLCKGNPGVAFLAALKSVLNVEVMGLFVEVSDEYGGNKGGVVLGGGVVIARTGVKEKYCMPGGTLHTSKDLRVLSFSNQKSIRLMHKIGCSSGSR